MVVLIYGLGSIARKHIAALRQVAPEDLQIYALRHGGHPAPEPGVISIADEESLPAVPDFAIISNPTALHAGTIARALKLGCPLFIEKPSVSTMAEAAQTGALIRQAGVLSYVACNLRFHPTLLALKAWLPTMPGRINEVNVYAGSYLPDWRPGTDWRNDYSARPELGGRTGALADAGGMLVRLEAP